MKSSILSNFNDAISSFSYVSYANDTYIKNVDAVVGLKNYIDGISYNSLTDSLLSNVNTSYRINFDKSLSKEYWLPKAKNFNNWITLINDLPSTILINYDDWKSITIKAEGQKIMGSYEPLVCDIPFYTLRLSYIDHTTGWVIT